MNSGSLITVRDVKFWWLLCLSILLQYLMASIYIPVTYPSSQMLGLGFLRPTLHGNWLVKAMWEICLTYSLGLIILLWILRRIRNYSLSNVLGYCGIWFESGSYRTHVVVIPCNSNYFLTWIRKFNDLPAPRLLRMESTTTAIFFDSTLPYELGIGIPLTCFIAGTVELPRTWLLLLVTCFILFSIGRVRFHGNLRNFIDTMQEMHMEPLSVSLLLLLRCLNGLLIITCWNSSCLSLPPIREYWNTSREEQISFKREACLRRR